MSRVDSAIQTTGPTIAGENAPAAPPRQRLGLEAMDPRLTSIQPGGGLVIRLELGWGRVRRWYLKTFRRRYVERMRALRRGKENRCPHEVLDPRDLKFHCNQGGYYWDPQDDPFRWRQRLPFAREGLAELVVLSLLGVGGATASGVFAWRAAVPAVGAVLWGLSAVLAAIALLVVWFFRNPPRRIPQDRGAVLAPADGKVVRIEETEHDEFIGGPAVTVGIFLSIFNVHVNRAPVAARVIGLRYRPGKCLNALRPESARENEQLAVRLEASDAPHRRMVVRQITGAIARRIVCRLKPGDELAAGEAFGMIKLGSRTELVLPREEGLNLLVKCGARVKAGSSLIAVYTPDREQT